MEVAKDDSRNISTGDLSDAEIGLGDICHYDAVNESDDRDTSRMLVTVVEPLEYLIYDESGDDGYREEQHCLEDDHPDIGVGVLCAEYESQDDNADDIVDDGGAHDGRSDSSVELAEFLEGSDCDADRGCGHDGTDEKGFVELLAPDGVKSVEAHEKDSSEDYGDENAGTRDGGRLKSRLLELFHVSCKARLEHEHDDADLGHLGNEVSLADKAKDRRSDQYAGEDLTDDFRSVKLAGKNAQGFRAQ